MAFDDTPTLVISGWSEDGTTVSFPIASVPELTAAEADASTGDSRKIIYAMVKQFADWYSALATADRPGKLTINEGTAIEDTNGNFSKSFNFQFTLAAPGALEVASE